MKKNKFIVQADDADFEAKVKDLLLYRKIVKVSEITSEEEQKGILLLDNGVKLIVYGNEGCGGCGNGWYYLKKLQCCDNAITDVKCVINYESNKYGDDVYQIFVFTEDKEIECIRYEGYDNGYYGTGFNLYVEVDV